MFSLTPYLIPKTLTQSPTVPETAKKKGLRSQYHSKRSGSQDTTAPDRIFVVFCSTLLVTTLVTYDPALLPSI